MVLDFASRGEQLRKSHGGNFMIAFHVIITVGHSLSLKNKRDNRTVFNLIGHSLSQKLVTLE